MTDQSFLDAVKKGNRYCVCCGLPVIQADEPEWKKQCSACYAAAKPVRFCPDCGSRVDRHKEDFAKRKKLAYIKCFNCSKGFTQPHPVHEVKLPDRFYLSLR